MDRRRALQLFVSTLGSMPALSALSLAQREALAGEIHAKISHGSAATDTGAVYRPRALDAHQFELVTRIADLILPPTDTPGAKSLRVHEFIDLLLAESLLQKNSDAVRAGLAQIDDQSTKKHGRDFLALSVQQQIAVLESLDAASNAARKAAEAAVADSVAKTAVAPSTVAAAAVVAATAAVPVTPNAKRAAATPLVVSAANAFTTLKELTLYGYFSSEEIMKNVLHAPIVPGRFDGCVPLQSV